MGSRVELFERIRRDRDREELSIRALAQRFGVHRRAVRRALVDEWLLADREAPRKQHHTAKRIWQRLLAEHGADVAETTVREYVRRRRRELGEPLAEAFVPQVHLPGEEAEVD